MSRRGVVEVASGISGFRLLRLGGSAFHGFVRDQYTTLPDLKNRPLHMWLDLEWRYVDADAGFTNGAVTAHAREIVRDVFRSFESGSIQQVIYQTGTRLLREIASIAEVHLEANNRTWDTIAERGDELGVYTEARPPYGCLGLTLKRE
jgi:urate oxidase